MIGFPPGLLGNAPLRIPLIHDAVDWIAIEKPAGVGVRKHPWDMGVPDMDTALNNQLKVNKPELLRLNARVFGSIYYLEPEASGVFLFAKNRESLARLRNQVGSEELCFRFLFVAKTKKSTEVRELTADVPLLSHKTKPKMIPSTAKGKKAKTHFRLLFESDLGWSLWEASASYIRPHQVRAHAAIHGIPILGDMLYSGPEAPQLNEFLPRKRKIPVDGAIFSGVALHLCEVSLPIASSGSAADRIRLLADLPNDFQLMLKRMKLIEPGKSLFQSCGLSR